MVGSKQKLSVLAAFAAVFMLLSLTFSFLLHITFSVDDYIINEMQGAFYITQTASMTVPPDTERTGRYNASMILSGNGIDKGQRADLCFGTYSVYQIIYDYYQHILMLGKQGANTEFNPTGVIMRC